MVYSELLNILVMRIIVQVSLLIGMMLFFIFLFVIGRMSILNGLVVVIVRVSLVR